jgi:hypothetical protein
VLASALCSGLQASAHRSRRLKILERGAGQPENSGAVFDLVASKDFSAA